MLKSWLRILFHLLLSALALAMFFPMAWMVFSSMKDNRAIFDQPWALPERLRWENFAEAWKVGHLGTYLFNSLLVGTVSVLGILFFASLAAYAFARLEFKGREFLFYVFLVGLIIPIQSFLLPLFVLLRDLRLINTYWALILPYVAWGLPLAIYLLRAHLLTLPKDLEDSARIDGCSRFGIYWHILLPVVKPALATVAIISALEVWNEFLMALLFIYDDHLKTLPVGLLAFYGHHSVDYKLLFSALSIITIPMIILYFVFQRHIIEGLTVGALKE